MNAWTQTACISVRCNRGGRRRPYLPGGRRRRTGRTSGRDIQRIPLNRPTMNLQAFTMNTPESRVPRRVVPACETRPHRLDFPHEHMRKELIARIDPQEAYRYFLATQGWNQAMVDAQVLTPLDDASIMGTPPDQESIMCYRLPALDHQRSPARSPVGSTSIATDFAFAGPGFYPDPGNSRRRASAQRAPEVENWPASEDVEVGV